MKQKSGIALVSMILFILLCSSVFAGDENTASEYEDYFDLGPDEDFMVEIHYEIGNLFYHIITKWRTYSLRNKNSSKPDILYVSFLSVPELSHNFRIFVEGLENKEIEPIVIKNQEELINAKESINDQLENNKELIEFIKKYWGGSEEEIKKYVVLDDEYIEDLTEALKEGYWLCGFVCPEYLYEKEEFILRIDFDTKIVEEELMGSAGFYKNWFLWRIFPETENFDYAYFILPQNARPWIHNANQEIAKRGRKVLKWNIKEDKAYLLLTFGIPEERLHWENYINNIQNFIYIVFGIFLAVTAPIILVKFKKYRFIKWVVIFCSPFLFFLLMRMHVYNQNIEDIPIETCVGGECLKGTPLFIAVTFFIVNIALFSIFHFCIDKREEIEEKPKLEEEVTKEKPKQKKKDKKTKQKKPSKKES